MSRIRSKNTKPELIVRKYLFNKGFRYRINYNIPGKPDIAFPKKKIAIFIHGCFWHQHGCKNSFIPKSNTDFWIKKLESNKIRDFTNKIILLNKNWKVIIIWECEINSNFNKIITELEEFIK